MEEEEEEKLYILRKSLSALKIKTARNGPPVRYENINVEYKF